MRKKIKYTVKQWNNLTEYNKKYLLKTKDVILTDHKTGKEKAINILKKFNPDNLREGIDKTQKGINQFSKMMDQLSANIPDKDTSFLTGNKTDKKDYSFLTGKKKK